MRDKLEACCGRAGVGEVPCTGHAVVVRTYVGQWPRRDRAAEKVLIIVAGPDEETRHRFLRCGQRGKPVATGVVRWPTLDMPGKRCFLESGLPRIIGGEHGKITSSPADHPRGRRAAMEPPAMEPPGNGRKHGSA